MKKRIKTAFCMAAFGALTTFGGRTIYIYTTGEGTMPTGWNKFSF